MSEKPPIIGEGNGLSPALLDDLLYHIGTLASVYHKPPETFIAGKKYGADNVHKTSGTQHNEEEDDATAPPAKIKEAIKNNDIDNLLDLDWDEPAVQENSLMSSDMNNSLGDLMSLDSQQQPQQQQQQSMSNGGGLNDIMKLYNQPLPTSTPMTFTSSAPIQPQSPQQPNNSNMSDLFDLSSIGTPTQPTQSTNNNNNNSNKSDPFAGLF